MIAPVDPIPQMPSDLREMLDSDPRLEGLQNKPGEIVPPTRTLKPDEPPRAGESGLVRLYLLSDDRPITATWQNPPKGVVLPLQVGDGRGFARITQKPVLVEKGKPAKARPDAFEYTSWLTVSHAFADVVRRFAPHDIETIAIDWKLGDDSSLEGWQFLDVRKLVDAYDYRRSEFQVMADRGKRVFNGLGSARATKAGVDTVGHICRDSFLRQDILVSRALAAAMVEARLRGVMFQELATGRVLDFDYVG